MPGSGRKGKEKGGKQTRREVGGWGEIHTRQLGRKTERWGLGRCAWPAWGDRDGEELGGKGYKYKSTSREGRRTDGQAAGSTWAKTAKGRGPAQSPGAPRRGPVTGV